MCTRYVLLQQHLRDLLKRLGLGSDTAFETRYNIGPATAIPAIRASPRGGKREQAILRWGLVPAWSKTDQGAPLVNARADTAPTKPAFRDAFRKRRCVVPASGFYEWQTVGRSKQPWYFRRRDEAPFGFAGLWESWPAPDGTTLESCAILTTVPNELIRPLHDRMPILLTPEQCEAWLNPGTDSPTSLAPLLQPAPAAEMTAVAVSRYVSNVRHEGPACLAPAGPNDTGDYDTPQLSLGL